MRSREVQTLGSLWRWRRRERGGVTLWTSSCDPSATSSAVLSESSGWCLRFSSPTVRTVYEMARFLCFPLLCTETGTHSAFLSAGFGVLQYIDKVVDVGTWLLYGGLWKNFTYFLHACAVCLESGPYFLEPLVLAAICPCALRQSTDAFGRISSTFYVKSGLRAPRAVLTLES